MSAIEVDGQLPSMAGLSRTPSRSGASAGQDDGAFGAMMADLSATPGGARAAPRDAADASATGEEATDAKAAKAEAGGLDELLSQVLSGAKTDEDAGTKTHADRSRKTRDAAAAGVQAGAGTVAGDATASSGEGTDEADALADALGGTPGRSKLRAAKDETQAQADKASAQDAAPAQAAAAEAQAALRAAAQTTDEEAAKAKAEADAHAASAPVESTEADAVPVDVPTMRVKVLSRETHFAPVRSWSVAGDGGTFAEKTAGEAGDSGDVLRSDAFAASPRERAAMRLEQARMQDAALAESGSTETSVEETGADSGEGLLAATDMLGTVNSGLQGGLPLNSLRQVSTAIGAEVARMVDPSFVSDADTDTLARGSGPLRLIAIQLQPLELGTVTVRMRLSDDGLDVRISASNPATARMLQQDQARLADLLQAQGIDAATVTVTNASDQAAAWSRFEMTPRGATSNFSGQGDGERSSGQQQGQSNSGNGRDEGENASGGRRSGRNSG